MSEYIFQAHNLVKRYKSYNVLDRLNMNVKKGEIYGFIGENGAGKTTTIKIICGLTEKTDGEIKLFGESSPQEIIKLRNKIGCIIEAPSAYPEMTAEQNMEVQRIQRNIKDKTRVKSVLELVGLTDTGRRKSKNFSLGMKQRLGLAAALISEPEFLILDEPTNGLDPIGIIELRNLLKKLCSERGISIVVSSHILTELHQIATCYGIIHKGVMTEELTRNEMDEKCSKYVILKTPDSKDAEELIKSHLKCGYTQFENGGFRIPVQPEEIENICSLMYEKKIRIKEIFWHGETLESHFKTLIGE